MSQESTQARGIPTANHNWPLMRRLIALLRKSSVGLTPSTLLELIEEEGADPGDEVSRRGTYQRVLRALQQLESMGLVVRSGRRYILEGAVLQEELRRQARQAAQRVLETPFLTADPEEIRGALAQALQELLRSEGKES